MNHAYYSIKYLEIKLYPIIFYKFFLSIEKVALFYILQLLMLCFDLNKQPFLYVMPQVDFYIQFIREFINDGRAKIEVQPPTFDGNLNESTEHHSARMITTELFSYYRG